MSGITRMNDPIVDPSIEIPTVHQPNQQPPKSAHQCQHHGHGNHQHHHHEHSINPFANVPKEMRVFIWQSILDGSYLFSIYMQLPMIGYGYYLYMQILQTILMPIYRLNGAINQFIKNDFMRKLFGGMAVYYFLVHGILFYFYYATFPQFQILLYLIYSIIFVYLLVILCPPGYLNQDEFQDIIQQREDIMMLSQHNRNLCILCKIPKIIRSQHCIYCQKCVKRFEAHSMIFNTCIGLFNYPFYILFSFLVSIYILLFIYQFAHPDRKEQKSYIDILTIVINLQQLYFFGQQTLLSFLRISYNITSAELQQWRRFSYMWITERGQFGNPFDKGMIHNWIQFFKPLFIRSGLDNWATNKYLTVADIPNHPLAKFAQENIDQQIRKIRQMEKMQMRQFVQHEDEEDNLLPS